MSNQIDVSPLAGPVNPLSHAANQLRAQRYPSQETATQATEAARWYDWLAARIQFRTTEPVLAFTLARLARDHATRRAFRQAIDELDAAIVANEAARQVQPAAQPQGGFKAE